MALLMMAHRAHRAHTDMMGHTEHTEHTLQRTNKQIYLRRPLHSAHRAADQSASARRGVGDEQGYYHHHHYYFYCYHYNCCYCFCYCQELLRLLQWGL